LRGRQVFHQFRRKSYEFARQMFARATVIDPRYAQAFAGVADCCSFLYMYFEASEENLQEAAAASRRAVELDPESAEAHASRGLAESLRKNYDEAEKEFEAAIRLNPKLYDTYYFYARSCFSQGKMEKAAGLFESASVVNPDDYQARGHLVMCFRALGRKEEALQACRETLRVAERHVELYPEDARALYLGASALCQLGAHQLSREWAARAVAVDPEETTILYNVACNYALLQDTDQALDCLEKAVRNGFGHKEWIENDPDFAALRTHPRFQALIQRMSADRATSAL